ncbi:MAG TPA: hypothetical protein VG992_03065 [Candidatus Saccharimonadales bacterium]|nr:hypothetical protein [Candidatus Saccharimonadales bacterium]
MTEAHIITDPQELSEAVLEIREQDLNAPLFAKLGGGVNRFVEAVFPRLDRDHVYAHAFDREEPGIGPHFDVYENYLHDDYPWVGVFNLAGRATVRAATLRPELKAIYDDMFPERTDEAGEARRHFGALALQDHRATVYETTLEPGVGMVLPQRPNGLEIVHEVTPVSGKKGRYLKAIAPDVETESTIKDVTGEFKYKQLDELLTEALGGEVPDVLTDLSLPPEMRLPSHRAVRRRRGPDFSTRVD